MILFLFIVPFMSALLIILVKQKTFGRVLFIATTVSHLSLTVSSWFKPLNPILNGWFALDSIGVIFLSVTSLMFCLIGFYAIEYLIYESSGHEPADRIPHSEALGLVHKQVSQEAFTDGASSKPGFEKLQFSNAPESLFLGCLLIFLGSMAVVISSQHFGILWIAMEATTLVTAPLIYFHRHAQSLEATWKYLLICSVGIALALMGNMFMAVCTNSESVTLMVPDLCKQGANINDYALKMAFIFLLVGYGTKMGLAPFHTWLPDAHSEAPSAVSALLSGTLLNCAFIGVLRGYQVCLSAGIGDFARNLFLIFGIISVMFAAFFIVGQTDYKRMLAYSSVENMGIITIGIGLGGEAVFGSFLHVINHSFTKGLLFLLAGNIYMVYKSKAVKNVSGMIKKMPLFAILWVAGFLAISGTPPFGMFISKLIIIKTMIFNGHYLYASIFLILLAVIFMGVGRNILQMTFTSETTAEKDDLIKVPKAYVSKIVAIILCFIILLIGVYLPRGLINILNNAKTMMESF